MVDEQIVNTIIRYVTLLNQEGFDITKAFLYGSFSTGKTHETSDIDLMLVSGSLDENDTEKKSRAWVLTRKVDTRIEPYIVNLERFLHDDSSPLLEIVRQQAVEIRF